MCRRGREKKENERKERDRETRPLSSKETGRASFSSSSILFLLARSLPLLSPAQKSKNRQVLPPPLIFDSFLFLPLSTARKRAEPVEQSAVSPTLSPPHTHTRTHALPRMSAAAAPMLQRPSSRDGVGGGVDAAAAATTTTPAAAIARPGSGGDNKNSSGRKEGSGRETQKRAFDLVLR